MLAIACLAFVVTGCKKGAEEAKTGAAEAVNEVVAETKYKAIPAKSMIMWTANKVVGGHSGTINVSTGIVKFEGNNLVGGSFIFDMNTLANTDIEKAEGRAKLETHLKNEDFFDVEKFPNASFEITKVEGNTVSGNLAMKGIKKNITFPVNVSTNDDILTLSSDVFTINRTEWGVNYNSGKFADPAKLGDYMIRDDVEIKISVKATKA